MANIGVLAFPSDRHSLESMLSGQGHNLIFYTNPTDALEKVTASPPDLLITGHFTRDEMSGLELATKLRESYDFPIVLTDVRDQWEFEELVYSPSQGSEKTLRTGGNAPVTKYLPLLDLDAGRILPLLNPAVSRRME